MPSGVGFSTPIRTTPTVVWHCRHKRKLAIDNRVTHESLIVSAVGLFVVGEVYLLVKNLEADKRKAHSVTSR